MLFALNALRNLLKTSHVMRLEAPRQVAFLSHLGVRQDTDCVQVTMYGATISAAPHRYEKLKMPVLIVLA